MFLLVACNIVLPEPILEFKIISESSVGLKCKAMSVLKLEATLSVNSLSLYPGRFIAYVPKKSPAPNIWLNWAPWAGLIKPPPTSDGITKPLNISVIANAPSGAISP